MDTTRQALEYITERIAQLDETSHRGRTPAYAREFSMLQSGAPGLHEDRFQKYASAIHEDNRGKNRYTDVLPYEDSRVILKGFQLNGTHNSDYINANFILDPTDMGLPVYIATQGPLDNTIPEFWHTAKQENCSAIISLTKPIEAGRVKCSSYFPLETGIENNYGNLTVKNVSTKHICPGVAERIFEVYDSQDKTSKPFLIRHYQYEEWPDHGVPEDTRPIRFLMQFLRTSELSGGPFLIHCSAGIGRTGTYIIIDHTLRKVLEGDLSALVDIPSRIQSYRTQREGLVQTKEQYRMCFAAVRDELEDATKSSDS